jgi:acyl CoA:acetate/3-ketoacid CoA transferase alpha subunit
MMATAAKICVAEVEHLASVGELDPDQVASVQTTIKSLEDAIRNGLKKKIKSLSPS